jgi:hypothetical protein
MARIVFVCMIVLSGCESLYKSADESSDSGMEASSSDTNDEGGDSDADGSDADGSDADGSDADGSDADGSDADGSDADGSDADGSDAGDPPAEPEYEVRTELPEDYLSLLTETLACSDTWMHMYSEDRTIGLTAYVPNLVSSASGEAYNKVTNVPHETVTVTLEVGGNIPRNWCTDDMSDDLVISASWVANFGTVSMFVEALETPESTPRGHFTLSGLDFDGDMDWVTSFESPVMDILLYWGG